MNDENPWGILYQGAKNPAVGNRTCPTTCTGSLGLASFASKPPKQWTTSQRPMLMYLQKDTGRPSLENRFQKTKIHEMANRTRHEVAYGCHNGCHNEDHTGYGSNYPELRLLSDSTKLRMPHECHTKATTTRYYKQE